MMEYYIDDDGTMAREPITVEELCKRADHFTASYFPSVELDLKIALNTHSRFARAAAFDPTTMTIHISQHLARFHELAQIALLHEMVHVKLYSENNDPDAQHGQRFQAEIQRLKESGAYDRLLYPAGLASWPRPGQSRLDRVIGQPEVTGVKPTRGCLFVGSCVFVRIAPEKR